VGPLAEAHLDGVGGDGGDLARGLDEVPIDVAGLSSCVAAADAGTEEAVRARSHEGELGVAVDHHRDRRGQRVHVEEVDAVGDGVLDQHPHCVGADEPGGTPAQLVGDKERQLLVAEVGDRQLADRAFVVAKLDPAINDPRAEVGAARLFSSTRRQADPGAASRSSRSFGPRRQRVMKAMPTFEQGAGGPTPSSGR